MKRTLCSLALAAAFAACAEPPPPPPPDTTEADMAAIRQWTERFLGAYNAQDLATMESLFTEDYVSVAPEGPPTTGRAGIMALLAASFEQYTTAQTATVDEVAVFGDHGMVWGTWEEAMTPKAGGAEETSHGRWMVVYKRDADGSWKAWRQIYNVDQSTPPPGN